MLTVDANQTRNVYVPSGFHPPRLNNGELGALAVLMISRMAAKNAVGRPRCPEPPTAFDSIAEPVTRADHQRTSPSSRRPFPDMADRTYTH